MSSSASGAPQAHSNRRSLLAIAVVCVLPVIASYFAFYIWTPQRSTNYGELLSPTPLKDPQLATIEGRPFQFSQLRGRWIMLTVDGGACDASCRDKLYKLRQVRLTQGKDMDRIERTWIVNDGIRPAGDLVAAHAGTFVIDGRGADLLRDLPAAGDAQNYIYVVDPLGNLMLRYPKDADPSRMKKDFTRLLKVSRVG